MSLADAIHRRAREQWAILRSEIDFDIVGDNLKDIAGFTIEKYEYIERMHAFRRDPPESAAHQA